MKTNKTYIAPEVEMYSLVSLVCSNTYDPGDESGLVDIASSEKDASLGQANDFSFEESEDNMGQRSLWDD